MTPIHTLAKKLGCHPDSLVALLNRVECPMATRNGRLLVDVPIAVALLRAEGIIAPTQTVSNPVGLIGRSEAAKFAEEADLDEEGDLDCQDDAEDAEDADDDLDDDPEEPAPRRSRRPARRR